MKIAMRINFMFGNGTVGCTFIDIENIDAIREHDMSPVKSTVVLRSGAQINSCDTHGELLCRLEANLQYIRIHAEASSLTRDA